MSKKWKNIYELMQCIAEDDTLSSCKGQIKRICYAPNIGYCSWIFKYNGTLVALFDAGNGHYEFHTAVTRIDMLIAQITTLIDNCKHIKTKGEYNK